MMQLKSPIKLNLGCFNKKLPGFINVDIREEVNPDVVDDAFQLDQFQENSVDLIYSSHMLEHLSFGKSYETLKRWYQILKIGGILRLAIPDVEAACKWYLEHRNLYDVRTVFWGSQLHPFDFHYHGWDFQSLKTDLNRIGFKGVKRWDWKTTEPHNYVDDYSSAYLPHMDKVNGTLISLNVEAIK